MLGDPQPAERYHEEGWRIDYHPERRQPYTVWFRSGMATPRRQWEVMLFAESLVRAQAYVASEAKRRRDVAGGVK
jgi:hypothetical protein